LASEIEGSSGFDIKFRLYSDAERHNMPEVVRYASANVNPDLGEGSICLGDIQPNYGVLLHELLHLQRWCVDGVPQLGLKPNHPFDRHLVEGIKDLENQLEHLIIVPMEVERTGDISVWETSFAEAIKRWCPTEHYRVDLLKLALAIHLLVPGTSVQKAVDSLLERYDIAEAAFALIEAAPGLLRDKPSLVLATLNAMELPLDAFQLQWVHGPRFESLV
jgi:hypothetical protein